MNLIFLVVGSIVGAVALDALTLVFHSAFFRSALGDGQYAFVFFLLTPMGALLGGLTGAILFLVLQGDKGSAGRLALMAGGGLCLFCFLLGMSVLSGTQPATLSERLGATTFWCATSMFWAGGLALYGIYLLWHCGRLC